MLLKLNDSSKKTLVECNKKFFLSYFILELCYMWATCVVGYMWSAYMCGWPHVWSATCGWLHVVGYMWATCGLHVGYMSLDTCGRLHAVGNMWLAT